MRVLLALSLFLLIAPQAAQATMYAPGATLDPACAPTDSNCGVQSNTAVGTLGQVPYYAAAGNVLAATSTFQILTNGTASTTSLVVSNSFTLANLSGFLKATAGAIATSLINLASDVTGILPVSNGGTGVSAIQSGFIPFGNGTGAVATSSGLYWDNTNGRLGIGTTSPVTDFAVNGNAYISGGLTATNATSTNLYASSITAGNIVSPIQQMNPYALRSTRTKAGLIALNGAGYSGYSTPAQLYMVVVGDSTAGFHASELNCTLAAQYGYAGYIMMGTTGNTASLGFNCPTQGYTAFTFTGGATTVTGDFAHFPNGGGIQIPSGGSAIGTTKNASTRQIAYYTADTAGATITVSTSPDGTTWTPLPACNGVSVAVGVGGVCDTTIASGTYYLQVSASGGTVYLWGVGQVDTTVNGVVTVSLGVGGVSLPDVASTPSAIVAPWFADINPDLITFEMKNNGVSGANCTQAPTATPSNLQPRSYWWNIWTSEWQTANPLADFVIYGSYPINQSCISVYNSVEQQWANSTSPQQTYIDNYSQLTNAQMQSLGWIDTSVHESPLGQVAHGDLDMQYLGILQWPTAVVGQNVNNRLVTTSKLAVGATGYIKNDNSNLDISMGANRGFAFFNQSTSSPLKFAYLGDPSQPYPSSANFLPQFQSSLYTGGSLVMGPWIGGSGTTLYIGSGGVTGGLSKPAWVSAAGLELSKTTANNSTAIATSSGVYVNTLTTNIGNVVMTSGFPANTPIVYQTVEDSVGGHIVGNSPSYRSFSEPNPAANVWTTQYVMADGSGGGLIIAPAIDSNGNSITKTGQLFISNSGTQSWISALSGGSFGLGTTLGAANGSLSLATLGIGTTSPFALLSVSNSRTTAANTPLFAVASTTNGTATTTVFSIASTGDVTINGSSGSTCTVGNGVGATSCTSDERLKTNIALIVDPLKGIEQLRGVTFNWKDPTKNQQQFIGVIAQDVQKVFPQAVVTNADGYLAVDYAVLVAPLIEAVKELAGKVNTLAATVAGFANEIITNRVDTKTLCLTDSSGSTCYTRSQLNSFLNQGGQQSNFVTGTNASPITITDVPLPDITPDTASTTPATSGETSSSTPVISDTVASTTPAE